MDSFDLVYLDYFIALLVPELQSSREGNFSRFFLVSREKWLKISRFSREIKMREKWDLYLGVIRGRIRIVLIYLFYIGNC